MSRLTDDLRTDLGPTAKALDKHLGLRTVEDLLRHYPRRWVERGELTRLSELVEGESVTVIARVARISSTSLRSDPRRALVNVVVTDDAGDTLSMAFFGPRSRIGWYTKELPVGRLVWFAGTVGRYRDALQLVHPEHEVMDDDDDLEATYRQGELQAVYPCSGTVTTWKLARAVRTVLRPLQREDVPDPIPADVRAARGLPDLYDALESLHFGWSRAHVERARARLRYEEAFVLQTALALRRAALSGLPATSYPRRSGGLADRFDASLPFALTAGQASIGEQVAVDLARTSPMNRLLQGEVGSGKTLVALRAMLQVVDAGAQAALLAPTEVLAVQHHRSLTAALGELAVDAHHGAGAPGQRVRVRLLTGSLTAAARRRALLDIAGGAAGIVVGTHALLQDAVDFADLGLVVIDEQHRFGVEQRDTLRAKAGLPPHVLVMTATPIPRTVAMTVFGDLEVSALTELPPGRSPITTSVVHTAKTAWVARCWARVREEVDAGRQAFVVCPRIGGEHSSEAAILTEMEIDLAQPSQSGTAGAAGTQGEPATAAPAGGPRAPGLGAVEVAERLSAEPVLAGLRLGLLHGRLPADEKEAVMTAFARGELDVLVATTVIEVGVDVPNATVMVVMDADRFGLSQLHQLRGRVGRGGHPGLCLLVTDLPPGSTDRLDAVAATTDGFEIADLDLRTRREGDVLGAAQSGRRSSLRMLRIPEDEAVITQARLDAEAVVAADHHLATHPELARALAALDADREAYLGRG